MHGWRCRIGLVTPPDNLLIEPELKELAPDGVSVYSTRLREIDLDTMPEEAEIEAANYGEMGANVVAYACNISSFHEGPGSDEEIVAQLSEASGLPATTASTAMVRALAELDVERIGVVTPYNEEENDLLQRFLVGNGFELSSMSGLGLTSTSVEDVKQLSQQTASDTYRRVVEQDDPEDEAVLITATNLASVGTIREMEADVGKPVVSANTALLWHALELAGVEPSISEAGTLIEGES
jgi:maleate cis-trans isomerase